MKKTAFVLFSIVVAASALAQVRPISIDDLLAVKRVGSPPVIGTRKTSEFVESSGCCEVSRA